MRRAPRLHSHRGRKQDYPGFRGLATLPTTWRTRWKSKARCISRSINSRTRADSVRFSAAAEIKRLGYHGACADKSVSPEPGHAAAHQVVIWLRSIEQCDQRPGIQETRDHERQLRWRICFRQESFSQCFRGLATLPTTWRTRWKSKARCISRSINSRTRADSVRFSAAARRLSASRCLLGRRMVRVVSI